MSGIYLLTAGKYFYVGLTNNLKVRKREHLSLLKSNIHNNPKMQRIYNKGYKFKFSVLEKCPEEQLNRKEIYWFNKYKKEHPELDPINLKTCGNRPTYSYESKVRMSKSKSKKYYDWYQRYIVYNTQTEELLYVGDILEISKTLNIDMDRMFFKLENWNDVLNCTISIIEELDEGFLEWYNQDM